MARLFYKFRSMTKDEKRERVLEFKPYLIIIVIPIFFTILFAEMFSPLFVEGLPIAIYDMDGSAKSREVISFFYDSEVLSITEEVDSEAEIKDMLLSGEICGAIMLPEGFGKALNGKKGTTAAVLMDNTNFMYGNNLMSEINTIFETVNGGIQIKLLEAGQQVPYQAEQNVFTLNLVDRVLYNPQLAYFYYLYAGLLAVFIQQVYLAATVPMLVEEKERLKGLPNHLRKEFIMVNLSLMTRRFTLMAGLSTISMMLCLKIAMRITGFPMEGNILILMLFQMVFLAAMTGMALVIASIFEQVAHAAQFTMFLTIPTFLSCGYAWPEYLMAPGFGTVMKGIWPLYYYINPMKDILLKGSGMETLSSYLIGCSIFAMIWVPAGLLLFRRKIRLIRELHEQ